MEEIKVGDEIFDKDGNITKVIHKSEIHHNPCYKITFSKDFSIIADKDHRWLISFSTHKHDKTYHGKIKTSVMTTEELKSYLETYNKKNQYQVPKIYINTRLNLDEKVLPIDPYLLGLWLGDGSSADGRITQQLNANSWKELEKRGYKLSDNQEHREDVKAEHRNIYGLMSSLKELGVLNNKHIPDIYQRGSFKQRLELLQGLMDADGFYDKIHKTYIMSTDHKWQMEGLVKLLSSLGIKSSVNYVKRPGYIGDRMSWDIKFKTSEFNPFLTRNQECKCTDSPQQHYYSIKSIEEVETVPTQCIEVDSSTHTFLCTEHMLVTHNTNKEIKKHSFYDSKTRQEVKMKHPLNNILDCNYYHYTLQLSTYAWMLQKLNPNFVIKDLIMVHFDHNDNQTVYHLDYLKDDVEKMLRFYKKELMHKKQLAKYERIEY
jgi:replicative DNA helicase